MSVRDRMYELKSQEEVDEFLDRFPNCALFKAGSCHKTMQGFGYVEECLDSYETLSLGFIRVIESRPASNYVEELTGLRHESPQLILFRDEDPVFEANNWDITPEALTQALSEHFGAPVEREGAKKHSSGDIAFYKDLLEKFLGDELTEPDFRQAWLMAFQSDASLRSAKEFALLNRLFGDVDAAIEGGGLNPLNVIGKQPSLRERAEALLQELKVYN